MRLSQEGSQTEQFERNLETGKSWLNVTESSMENIEAMVRAAMALAHQMATGTYNAAQRQAAAQQVQGYIEEVMQIGNTRFSGQHILAGLDASLDRVAMKENMYGNLQEELASQISTRGDTDIGEAVNLLKTKEAA